MPVGVVKVAESGPTHKIVHSMSKSARNQVLLRPEWRPEDPPPAKPSAAPVVESSDPWDVDIPF